MKQTGHWDWAHQTYWDSFEFFSISICSLLCPEILALSISGGIQVSNSRMFVVAEVNCTYQDTTNIQLRSNIQNIPTSSCTGPGVSVQMCDIGGTHIETIGGTHTTMLATASETII